MDTFREILHVDMNNCYASIETKLNPALRGLPIAVTGSVEERNGIVLAKSQEAKIMGVKTGEAIWEAKIKCPNLITVPPHYEEYLKHSLMAREIYYSYTNQVEPFGLDEAWLDVSGSKRLKGTSLEIANEIRNRMKNEVGVTVSIGVSFNKVFAKLVDHVIPGSVEYQNNKRNTIAISAKTTLRERWQQIGDEMQRTKMPEMYLATLDEKIGNNTLNQLSANNIYPVTTKNIKQKYYSNNNIVLTFEELLTLANQKSTLWKSSDFSDEELYEKKSLLLKIIEQHNNRPYVVEYIKRRLVKLEINDN